MIHIDTPRPLPSFRPFFSFFFFFFLYRGSFLHLEVSLEDSAGDRKRRRQEYGKEKSWKKHGGSWGIWFLSRRRGLRCHALPPRPFPLSQPVLFHPFNRERGKTEPTRPTLLGNALFFRPPYSSCNHHDRTEPNRTEPTIPLCIILHHHHHRHICSTALFSSFFGSFIFGQGTDTEGRRRSASGGWGRAAKAGICLLVCLGRRGVIFAPGVLE